MGESRARRVDRWEQVSCLMRSRVSTSPYKHKSTWIECESMLFSPLVDCCHTWQKCRIACYIMLLFEVITGDFASDFTCELRWNEVTKRWVSYAIHCSSMRSRVYSLVFAHYNACDSCVFLCDLTSPWPIISKVHTCDIPHHAHTTSSST